MSSNARGSKVQEHPRHLAQALARLHAVKRKLELPPGMRYLSTPGTNFESAVYALAIGWAADPQNTRPLDWSNLSVEKMTYDFLKSPCNIKMVEHMKKTAIDFDPECHTDPDVVCALIKAWKPRGPATLDIFIVWENGYIVVPALCDGGEASKQIYIRRNSNRWEGSGYFQDPVHLRAAHSLPVLCPPSHRST
ncbi:hypothetical protein M436DRAFT_61686 [Aureobasidium namibiae CBS 147.97]|uniref:Uncharacterized protein n=1 Tax=Aureobasidium namibiae CBS 147.97 TaxID=1043004 RepID=A0A074WZP3_9PEZI